MAKDDDVKKVKDVEVVGMAMPATVKSFHKTLLKGMPASLAKWFQYNNTLLHHRWAKVTYSTGLVEHFGLYKPDDRYCPFLKENKELPDMGRGIIKGTGTMPQHCYRVSGEKLITNPAVVLPIPIEKQQELFRLAGQINYDKIETLWKPYGYVQIRKLGFGWYLIPNFVVDEDHAQYSTFQMKFQDKTPLQTEQACTYCGKQTKTAYKGKPCCCPYCAYKTGIVILTPDECVSECDMYPFSEECSAQIDFSSQQKENLRKIGNGGGPASDQLEEVNNNMAAQSGDLYYRINIKDGSTVYFDRGSDVRLKSTAAGVLAGLTVDRLAGSKTRLARGASAASAGLTAAALATAGVASSGQWDGLIDYLNDEQHESAQSSDVGSTGGEEAVDTSEHCLKYDQPRRAADTFKMHNTVDDLTLKRLHGTSVLLSRQNGNKSFENCVLTIADDVTINDGETWKLKSVTESSDNHLDVQLESTSGRSITGSFPLVKGRCIWTPYIGFRFLPMVNDEVRHILNCHAFAHLFRDAPEKLLRILKGEKVELNPTRLEQQLQSLVAATGTVVAGKELYRRMRERLSDRNVDRP